MYGRKVENQTLEFGVSGKLWKNALVMYDQQTGSLWSHVTGEAIHGKLLGQTLAPASELRVIPRIRFADWKAQFPNTQVLSVNGRSEGPNRYVGYMKTPEVGVGTSPPAKDRRLSPKEMVLGVVTRQGARAYPLKKFIPGTLLVDRSERETLLVFHDPVSGAAAVYGTELDGMDLEFDPTIRHFQVTDVTTHSTWDLLRGQAVGGKATGKHLLTFPVVEVYWGAWVDYHPGTLIHGEEKVK